MFANELKNSFKFNMLCFLFVDLRKVKYIGEKCNPVHGINLDLFSQGIFAKPILFVLNEFLNFLIKT